MNRPNNPYPHRASSALSGTEWSQARGAGIVADLAPGADSLVNRLKLLVVVGLYIALFLWAYATILAPNFGSEGFALTWPGWGAMVWLMTVALLPVLILPYSLSRPSGLFLFWIYLVTYIPSILVPALSLTMPFEELLPLQTTLLVCMGFLCMASSARLLAVRQTPLCPALFWPAFWLVWGACLGFIVMSAGAGHLVGNLVSLFEGATEYTIRSLYREEVVEAGRSLAYVVGQFGGALNLFLIAFGLVYRRRMCLVTGIIGQVSVFSLTGFKAAVLSPIFLAFIALLIKHSRRSFGLALASGLMGIILISAIADHASGNIFFSSILTRRALAVPGLLTGFYFEHYSHFAQVGPGFHFSHDLAGLGPASEIGFVYMGSEDTAANANLWAEGFAEFGISGMVGYTIFVAFVMWIYDSISARHNLALAVLLAAMPAILLSNTAPTTMLISHGSLAAALVLYFAPSPEPVDGFESETEPEEGPLLSTAETSV